MNIQNLAESLLLEQIKDKEFSFDKWKEMKFEKFKFMSPTEKGDKGEDFLSNLLKEIGYTDVEVVKGRRGQYDVKLFHKGKEIKFEVKVATQDVGSNFQFNGIRFDTKYTHLFCIGILPTKIKYIIVPKEWLNNRDDFRVVPMQKNSNSTFKLTKSVNQLSDFENFEEDIVQIIFS